MKVAYIFLSDKAHYLLKNMIIPQMEKGIHGADVVGMFFVGDNTFLLQKGNNIGERLDQLSSKNGMLLLACDQCVEDRVLQEKLVSRSIIGCFPQFFADLNEAKPDQVISL
jgi:hypothetical protein